MRVIIMNIFQEREANRLNFCNGMAPYPQAHELWFETKKTRE